MKKILIIGLLVTTFFTGCSFTYEGAKDKYLSAKDKYIYIKDKAGKIIKVLKRTDEILIDVDDKLKAYDSKK